MLISTSILNIQNDKSKIDNIINSDTDMIHLDIMDGRFVTNKTINDEIIINNLKNNKKPIDIHFMTYDLIDYIDKYKELNPKYITFHIEADNNPLNIIKYIKSLGIKAGITLKPNTDIDSILDFLEYVDLVLVMSVEPGLGGQQFIEDSVNRINYLKELQKKYNYVIEVDGGINIDTIEKICEADIAVCGSYITSSNDYDEKIKQLKNKVN